MNPGIAGVLRTDDDGGREYEGKDRSEAGRFLVMLRTSSSVTIPNSLPLLRSTTGYMFRVDLEIIFIRSPSVISGKIVSKSVSITLLIKTAINHTITWQNISISIKY